MTDTSFMMGEFEARIPGDRVYSDAHMWLEPCDDDGIYKVGFTSYSVRLLQDVYFLEWSIDPQTQVRKKQDIGEIESSKAVSALYAPATGLLTEFNEEILNDPSAINADNYGLGWLFKLKTEDKVLTPEEYVAVLESGWQRTQNIIKGQLN